MAREYGAVMLKTYIPKWGKIISQVNEEDLFVDQSENIFGFESNPHVTLLYGLHANINHNSLISTISNFDPVVLKFSSVSGFENDDFDVLKIDIDPNPLMRYREILTKLYDYTDEHESEGYKPHITIAYLKSGAAKKYYNENVNGSITSNEIWYTSPKGHNIHQTLT